MEIAPRIRRIGNRDTVNAYLVEDAGEVTVIDAGAPAMWAALPGELEAMGRSLGDVRGIVLTHGHPDHVGFAETARRRQAWPILVHELDAALARGEDRNPAHVAGPYRPAPILGFLWYALRMGILRSPTVKVVGTFGDGATLDLPGAPRVVAVPGHTAGSAALHLPGHDALFVGDALCTYSVASGRRGPQIHPFMTDRATGLASLARLDRLDARLVLPGHGAPWTDGPETAIAIIRREFEAGA